MITEEELNKAEDEVYKILKQTVPFYVNQAMYEAASTKKTSFNWLTVVD